MVEREGELRKDRAEEELTPDEAFMEEHGDVLWPAARLGYERSGRGALIVDTKLYSAKSEGEQGEKHFLNFAYMTAHRVGMIGDENLAEKVRAYDPECEFVAVLIRPERTTAYCVTVLAEAERNARISLNS